MTSVNLVNPQEDGQFHCHPLSGCMHGRLEDADRTSQLKHYSSNVRLSVIASVLL